MSGVPYLPALEASRKANSSASVCSKSPDGLFWAGPPVAEQCPPGTARLYIWQRLSARGWRRVVISKRFALRETTDAIAMVVRRFARCCSVRCRRYGNDRICHRGQAPNPVCKPAHTDRSLCLGYIIGVSDSMQGAQATGASLLFGWRACPPLDTTPDRLQNSVVSFLIAHPETRQSSASNLVVKALSDAFPCAQ